MESRRLRACPICVFQNQKRVGCFKRHFLRRKKLLSFCLQMVFPRGFARVTFAVAEAQFFLPFLRRDQLNPHAVRCQHSEDEAVALPEIEHRRTRPAAPADVAANFFDCGANFTATRSSCGDNPRQQFQHVALSWGHGKRGNLVASSDSDSAGRSNINCNCRHCLPLREIAAGFLEVKEMPARRRLSAVFEIWFGFSSRHFAQRFALAAR